MMRSFQISDQYFYRVPYILDIDKTIAVHSSENVKEFSKLLMANILFLITQDDIF